MRTTLAVVLELVFAVLAFGMRSGDSYTTYAARAGRFVPGVGTSKAAA